MNIYIIIVTFNGIKWLPKCLESSRPYPVVVVDNCSTDGTVEFIKKNYPQIILLPQNENLGFGRANNIGISQAYKNGAAFFFLLNQDAWLGKETISTLIKESIKHTEYGILSPIHFNREGKDLETVFSYYFPLEEDKFSEDYYSKDEVVGDIFTVEMVNAAGWLLPRRTVRLVGGFHPMFFLYGEDDNYCQRVRYHNLKVGICTGAYICHDSGYTYHNKPVLGSKLYYDKFLNRVKVKYGDVNTNKYRELYKLELYYWKKALKCLFKFQFQEFRINMHKNKLLKDLDFAETIENCRRQSPHFLNV